MAHLQQFHERKCDVLADLVDLISRRSGMGAHRGALVNTSDEPADHFLHDIDGVGHRLHLRVCLSAALENKDRLLLHGWTLGVLNLLVTRLALDVLVWCQIIEDLPESFAELNGRATPGLSRGAKVKKSLLEGASGRGADLFDR